MVRAAVLKGKDPVQLIAEMEKIDQMGKFFSSFLLLAYHETGNCVFQFTHIHIYFRFVDPIQWI
jgi:hypothetical protein